MQKNTRISALAAFGAAILIPVSAWAHVNWTRINDVDPDIVALYHMDGHDTAVGDELPVASPLPAGLNLVVGPTTGSGAFAEHDTAGAIFGPHALGMSSTQNFESTAVVLGASNDTTIEFWFKWDDTVTSQTLTAGYRRAAKIMIARDTLNPANDRFGIQFVHGDYVSAPGFTNWAEVSGEADLGEWHHVAATIHSTGTNYDSGLGHDVYNSGSVARMYLNGHATGMAPHTIDITGKQLHDDSRIRIVNTNGTVYIDEFTIWAKDWSENGAEDHPFDDGRGSGNLNSSVKGWEAYD